MDYLKFNLVGQNVLPRKKGPKRPGQNILGQIVRGQNVRWPNCWHPYSSSDMTLLWKCRSLVFMMYM